MSAVRVAHAGRWWAVGLIPVLLVIAAYEAENAYLMVALVVFAAPLASLLAVPIVLRQIVARRRSEATTTRPFALTTLGVWIASVVFAAAFMVRSPYTVPSPVVVFGTRLVFPLLLLAWILQLVAVWVREPADATAPPSPPTPPSAPAP